MDHTHAELRNAGICFNTVWKVDVFRHLASTELELTCAHLGVETYCFGFTVSSLSIGGVVCKLPCSKPKLICRLSILPGYLRTL